MNSLRFKLAVLLLAIPVVAQPAAMSNYLRNKIVDAVFRGQSFTSPTTLCVALTTTIPTATSTGATLTEATYSGYARGQLNPSLSNWMGTGNETATVSAGYTGMTKNHAAIIVGSTATTGPTVVAAFVILDSCTIGSGNVLFFSPLLYPKTIQAGDPAPTFNISTLTVQVN